MPGKVWLEKDLILPYVLNVKICNAKCLSGSESSRTTLFFFLGRLKRNAGGKIRAKLVAEFDGVEGVVTEEGTTGSGCIPVEISDELELPFEGVLDYRKIVLFVSSSDAIQPGWLMAFLKNIGPKKIREMRVNLAKYARHFLYCSYAQPLGPENFAWRMIAGKAKEKVDNEGFITPKNTVKPRPVGTSNEVATSSQYESLAKVNESRGKFDEYLKNTEMTLILKHDAFIHRTLLLFDEWWIEHTFREANRAPDYIAKLAPAMGHFDLDVNFFNTALVQICDEDKNGKIYFSIIADGTNRLHPFSSKDILFVHSGNKRNNRHMNDINLKIVVEYMEMELHNEVDVLVGHYQHSENIYSLHPFSGLRVTTDSVKSFEADCLYYL
ncbi:hypothetical protein GIB67_025163 [Kingdonia uniflora]|uniref:Exostosin GT47 domain-containing protein n=1 Tax=Kingdonia uniflora TaxID=39325 RepID=A0A7J7N7V0_9MAGN|nr:hypothetical protein GIB67_025163 [Kingdonia uniflora]